MASTINIATFEQITDILSKLATNYSNMALAFYNVFYNPTPMDVTIQMFDEAGVLQTYVIPNRAKDRNLILNGEGNPEGSVAGSYGTIYQDTSNGEVFIKGTESGNTGWNVVVTKDILDSFIIHGVGNPEGIVEASKGTIFVDSSMPQIFLKATNTGTTGWFSISGRTVIDAGTTGSGSTTSWYRIYNDRWCEQGGSTVAGSVTFEKPYGTLMTATATSNRGYATITTKTNSRLVLAASQSGAQIDWTAFGYIS